MEKLNDVITAIDDFVWGPVMLILLVGTGIFLTIPHAVSDMEKSRLCTQKYVKQRGADEKPWRGRCVSVFGTDHSTCRHNRNGQHCGGCDGDGFRWPGSFGLDVDLCCIWSDVEVQ